MIFNSASVKFSHQSVFFILATRPLCYQFRDVGYRKVCFSTLSVYDTVLGFLVMFYSTCMYVKRTCDQNCYSIYSAFMDYNALAYSLSESILRCLLSDRPSPPFAPFIVS